MTDSCLQDFSFREPLQIIWFSISTRMGIGILEKTERVQTGLPARKDRGKAMFFAVHASGIMWTMDWTSGMWISVVNLALVILKVPYPIVASDVNLEKGVHFRRHYRGYNRMGKWVQSQLYILHSLSWDFTDFQGDGNGFKLGGGDPEQIGSANHIVNNSIAFSNAAKGFTDNKQPGNMMLTRNTAWNNGEVGFQITTAIATLEANIGAVNNDEGEQVSLSSDTVSSGNSWDGGDAWSNSSFGSVDTSNVQGERAADGKIVGSDFLIPVSAGDIGATTYW
ncbi:hypothetical protein AJ79_02363 [Helicocarpus griseus UAMH5409]|uniref:Right handed beta helix domain-containing protein n=1 Tax=Helicocarpus griseus UAMH5409 TaxID=1447875 RepID=A0A2B7Y3G0_9EURO|nr:hypothetical protein AJ79_02363 [Helicocarpus griseus UAMH5409]